MADDDGRLFRAVPRDPLGSVLDPTDQDRLAALERDQVVIMDRLHQVEETVQALAGDTVTVIHPQNPWARIAEARARLVRLHADGDIDDGVYDEAMGNLAAAERMADVGMATADGVVADLDSYRT